MKRRTMLKLCAAAPLAAQAVRALERNRPSWDGNRWRVGFLDFTSRMNVPVQMFDRWIMTIQPHGAETFEICGEKDPVPVLRRLPSIEIVCCEVATWFHQIVFRTPLIVLKGETLRIDLRQRIGDEEVPLSVEHILSEAYPTNGMFSYAQTNKRTFTFG